MNDHEFRTHVADVQKFAEGLIEPLSRLMQCAYDLREGCRFYIPQPENGLAVGGDEDHEDECRELELEDRQGGSGDAQPQPSVEHDQGADSREPEQEETPRHVIQARPNHILMSSRYVEPLPTTEDAWKVLEKLGPIVALTRYYEEFREYVDKHKMAAINQKGMRYLAHCLGYKTARHGTSKLVRPVK